MISDESGVKLFDRKFVASNLVLQLRCPKCTAEYSDRYQKPNTDNKDGHRPFVLACGHSMCETCIKKYRQNLKCAVCAHLSPPTIACKDPKTKFHYNVRDFFELNYHVIGETINLKYFRRYTDDSINNTLQFNSMSDIVVQAKCSECGHSQAQNMGECKQCNAHYCKLCFDSVHRHSRVLKTHVYRRIDEKNAAKSVRVGKDIFRIPSEELCSTHNRVKNIYCHRCRRTHCQKCTKPHHGGHKTIHLSELNLRFVDEIPSTIDCIDASMLDVKNCQQKLKNTKQQLNDYAAETLNTISECFRHMHGVLQNVELQIIESLRENSLAPQMKLNGCLSQLNGYELVLQRLRQLLHSDNTGNAQVPQDLWLKEVIEVVHEHLEKIPCSVLVSKIDKNPFVFASYGEDLQKLLQQYFTHEFINPNLQVRCHVQYDGTKRNPRSSSPTDSNISSVLSSHLLQRYTPGRQSKCRISQPQLKPLPPIAKPELSLKQEHEIVRSFSALDISSKRYSDEAQSIVSTGRMGDWFKSDVLVKVCGVTSPEDFYVQGVDAAKHLREQVLLYANSIECKPPSSIMVGQQYITYHMDKDRWHRSHVHQKLLKPDMYRVFLPDIGMYFHVHSNNFRQMSATLAKLPYAAVHCALRQLMPCDSSSKWTKEAANFLKEVVQNKPVHVSIVRALNDEHYEVDLITSNNNSNISVREAFLYTGYALARSGGSCAPGLESRMRQQPCALPSQRLPQTQLQFGDVLMIQMLHISHPQEFYVMRYEKEKVRRELLQALHHTMEHMSLSQLEQIYLGRLQQVCVVVVHGQWERVCIVEVLTEGCVIVRLVDHGSLRRIYWDQLFVLPRNFWDEPALAIKCCLADIEPLQENNYFWTNAAIDEFKQLVANPKLHMEVIRMQDGVAHVALNFTRSGSRNANVAALLVQMEHCVSNGNSSKVLVERSRRGSLLDMETIQFMEQLKELPNADKPAAAPKEQRVAITVLYMHTPGEFYVTFPHFLPAITKLMSSVQTAANQLFQGKLTHKWALQEACYVLTKSLDDYEPKWYRGVITGVSEEDLPIYDVQLRDVGQTVNGITEQKLTKIDDYHNRISDSAARCRLHGIVPNSDDGHWTENAIAFLSDQMQAFDSLLVTGHGREGKALLVTLWGAHSEISGPFSPLRCKYVDINSAMVLTGHARRQDTLLQQNSPVDATQQTLIGMDLGSDNEPIDGCFDTLDRLHFVAANHDHAYCYNAEDLTDTFYLEHNAEMPSVELLQDLNADNPTTDCNNAPAAWLQSRPCNKTVLTAKPTYINYDAEIFLTLSTDEPYITYMRALLDHKFLPMFGSKEYATKYVVGQPVVVTYHVDGRCYRGIILKRETRLIYEVLFIDYGNSEMVGTESLLPFAPFPLLHSMAWRVTLHGIQPIDGKYTLLQLDTLHLRVVTQLTSVRVIRHKGPGGLPACQLKVGNMDIATMMVDSLMAERVQQPKNVQLTMPDPPDQIAADQFSMFDALQDIGSTRESSPHNQEVSLQTHNDVQKMGGNESNRLTHQLDEIQLNQSISTCHPPPAKKKYTVNGKEVCHTNYADDFDCQMAAVEPKPERVNFEGSSDEPSNSDTESDIAERAEPVPFAGLNKISNEATSVSSPHNATQNVSIIDQLNRRIQLRHKEIAENMNFSPFDTSTVRSYYSGVRCFKEQSMPPGVKSFHCTIDSVLSGTELQISPYLSEFTKQNLTLTHETRAMIDHVPPLKPVELHALCLALYSQDQQWYRALVKELHPFSETATVFYIDFHNTETVAYANLKEMPKELYMFPLRSFRVKLHGVKCNKNFDNKMICQALQACVCQHSFVYARLHYPKNFNVYSDLNEGDDSSIESIRKGYRLLEVDLYANKHEKERLYEKLIDNWMYLKA